MKAEEDSLEYWDREAGCVRRDRIYAGGFVRWCYESRAGRALLDAFFSKRAFNSLYGLYKSSPISSRKISADIQDYGVKMADFEPGPFRSYADFFSRRFLPGARPFDGDPDILPAFAEGKYLAFDKIEPGISFPVKGRHLDFHELLKNDGIARDFSGGPMLICRLCPVDYHRYHYPEDGITRQTYRIGGAYHSVNPLALRAQSDVFLRNERHVSILQTERFGKLAYIEVGALCVGKIIQTHPEDRPFLRGDEKGHFLFGASTLILLGEPGAWLPSPDIVHQTRERRESQVKLGTKAGQRIR